MILAYGDPQFGATGDFSYPSSTGYTTRLDNSLAVCYWIVEVIRKYSPEIVVNLGDVFEQMGVIGSSALSAAAEGMGIISRACEEVGGRHVILLGNHDLDTQSSLVYSTNFLNYYPYTEVITKPAKHDNLVFIPFSDDTLMLEEFLCNLPAESIIFSHMDIRDVRFSNVSKYSSDVGVDKRSLARFKLVVNGHIHVPQRLADNIILTGSMTQLQYDQLEKDFPRGVLLVEPDGSISVIENTVSPKIIKVRSKEQLDGIPRNSYIIFENYGEYSEDDLTSLLSQYSKFRIISARESAPVKDVDTLQAVEPTEMFREFVNQLKVPLDKDMLTTEGLTVVNECLK